MPISKIVSSPSGAELTYHELHKLETTHDFNHVIVHIRGYASQAAAQNNSPVTWMWQVSAPIATFTSLVPSAIEALLVNDSGSVFFGGAVIPSETPLEQAKRTKRNEITRSRENFEFGGFDWSGYRFDSEAISQQRIQGSVQLAMVAQAAGQPFTIEWTLADNSVVTLDGNQMLAVGLAMGQHIQAAHSKSRMLKQQIDQAQSNEEIEAITW